MLAIQTLCINAIHFAHTVITNQFVLLTITSREIDYILP